MAYKCVHCDKVFEDGSKEVLEGCSQCRGKFFFYINAEKLKEITQNIEPTAILTEKEREQVEEDIRDIAGIQDSDKPVFLDFESIRVIKPGKYLLDVPKLFSSNKPQIYQLEDGKYIIDLLARFKKENFKQY
jgi:uncharacterized protein